MFICGMWKKIKQGPMHERRIMVVRCDLNEGHKSHHVDSVVMLSWPDGDCDIESRPVNEWKLLDKKATASLQYRGETNIYLHEH